MAYTVYGKKMVYNIHGKKRFVTSGAFLKKQDMNVVKNQAKKKGYANFKILKWKHKITKKIVHGFYADKPVKKQVKPIVRRRLRSSQFDILGLNGF